MLGDKCNYNTQHYGLGMTENCGNLVAACKQKKWEIKFSNMEDST